MVAELESVLAYNRKLGQLAQREDLFPALQAVRIFDDSDDTRRRDFRELLK